MFMRILRFGWLGAVILTLLATVGIGVAAVVEVSHPSHNASAAGPTAQRSPLSVSVTGVRILPSDPSHRPAANHEFVAIGVQLTDTGSTAVAYDISDFLLRDQAGNVFDADPDGAYLIGSSAVPVQGTLQPGVRRSGEIVFEVPMSDHGAMLLWQLATGPTGADAISSVTW